MMEHDDAIAQMPARSSYSTRRRAPRCPGRRRRARCRRSAHASRCRRPAWVRAAAAARSASAATSGEQHLLLVAAAELAQFGVDALRAHVVLADEPVRVGLLVAIAQGAPAEEAVQDRQRDVLGHRCAQRTRGARSIRGDEGDAPPPQLRASAGGRPRRSGAHRRPHWAALRRRDREARPGPCPRGP